MNTINVKPHPDLPAAAAKTLKSETGVGLLDAAGTVPEAGMPWPNGGLTLRLLTEGAIVRAEPAAAPGFTAWAGEQLAAQKPEPEADKPATEPEADPAH